MKRKINNERRKNDEEWVIYTHSFFLEADNNVDDEDAFQLTWWAGRLYEPIPSFDRDYI